MNARHSSDYSIRPAVIGDIPALTALIRESAHGLSLGDYTPEQIDTALTGVFGVDSQLIEDRTYFIIEKGGEPVACGGWSFRATLFGNDNIAGRDPRRLNPTIDAAKIRAFFVHPDHARRGLGKRILAHCEEAARAAGFRKLELGATLPGRRLYEVCGYVAGTPHDHIMEDGLPLRVVPMSKTLSE